MNVVTDTDNINKQLYIINQKRILLDPSNITSWNHYVQDRVTMDQLDKRYDLVVDPQNETPAEGVKQRVVLSFTL